MRWVREHKARHTRFEVETAAECKCKVVAYIVGAARRKPTGAWGRLRSVEEPQTAALKAVHFIVQAHGEVIVDDRYVDVRGVSKIEILRQGNK